MRLLVVLNENPPGSHVDTHSALVHLKRAGQLSEYVVFPWLAHFHQGLQAQEIAARILTIASDLGPTAILWAHTSHLRIGPDIISALRNLPSKPALGYWEGDAYERPSKPLPADAAKLAANCDVVFCQSFGATADAFRKAGSRDIRFVPGATDSSRFGKVRTGHAQIQYDLVLIGNKVWSKLPWRVMPGARWRKELVDVFSARLGERFAVFGAGWSGSSARGPLPFEQQGEAYHKGRLALGVNNLHGMYSFSNRLPIAMSAGVPVIYNYEPGFEQIFPPGCGCFFYRDTDECVALVTTLLRKDQAELDEIGAAAHAFAMSKLSMVKVFEYFIAVLNAGRLRHLSPQTSPTVHNFWLP